jgi:hypothetical protein
MLSSTSLDPASAELLCTAALTTQDNWLLGELWKRWEQLGASTRERLVSVDACVLAVGHDFSLLDSPAISGHEELGLIVSRVARRLSEQVGTTRTGSLEQDNAVGKVAATAMELGDDSSCLCLLRSWPSLSTSATFWRKPRAVELLGMLICEIDPAELRERVMGEAILESLGLIMTQSSSVEARGAALGILSVIVEWDDVCEFLFERPECIKPSVVAAWGDPGGQMKALMERIMADDQNRRSKVQTLIGCRDKPVARLVTLELPWDLNDLGLGLDKDDIKKLDVRKAKAAAEALSGDLAAQELLWGLSESWAGTVDELICACRQLTQDRTEAGSAIVKSNELVGAS